MANNRKLQCAEYVIWVVEPQGVVLIHTLHGRHRQVAYPEAAVWDLLTRHRSEKTICSMLELIAGANSHDAKKFVGSCLDAWMEEGWLEAGAPE